MTVDLIVSWLLFGLAAVVICLVLIRLAPQRRVRRQLADEPGHEGPAIVTRTRIREKIVYLWIAGVIIVIGGLQVIPHERYDGFWWFGILCILSIPSVMIVAIFAGDRDSEEAVRTHPDLP